MIVAVAHVCLTPPPLLSLGAPAACDFAHGMADMRILTLQEKERLVSSATGCDGAAIVAVAHAWLFVGCST